MGSKICKILIFANKIKQYEYIMELFENFGSNLGVVMVVKKFQEVGVMYITFTIKEIAWRARSS